ncbi:MAG: hypothetical protein HC877_23460 [Thioploca sp.]|nr:hypothetical protein [Thioploca sp.]
MKPNRNVPFQLPDNIINRLRKLTQELNLNTSSIDLIYDLDDELVFLEVNPSGQFDMVSHPCNYKLDKRIAEKLIEYDQSK